MSFRFRKSVRLFPGVRLNLSKSGMSVSVGGPGATLNFSPRGSSVTVGLPGSGLSYRARLSSGAPRSRARASPALTPVRPDPHPALIDEPDFPRAEYLPGEIRSAEVAQLTSADLVGLKRLLNEAKNEKVRLEPEVRATAKQRLVAWRRLRRAQQFPLRWLLTRALPRLQASFEASEGAAEEAALALAACRIDVDFDFDRAVLQAYERLRSAHARMSRASQIWDVTSSVAIDRARERTAASNTITRTSVRFSQVEAGLVSSRWPGLHFQNANGGDLEIFPGFCLMRDRASADYALIDIRELSVDFDQTQFIETEAVPLDSTIVGETWAKTNRDGSRDRRFRDNYQIPIALYGKLVFSSRTGVSEAYHVSDAAAAAAFADAYRAFQQAIRAQAKSPMALTPATRDDFEAEAITADPLPPLPPVRRAHEYTALALALLVGAPALALWGSSEAERQQRSPPAAEVARTTPAPLAPPPALPAPQTVGPSAARPAAKPQTITSPAPSPPAAPPASRQFSTGSIPTTAPAEIKPRTTAPTTAPPTVPVRPPSSGKQLYATARANVREAPDPTAQVRATLQIAAPLVELSRQTDWVEVADGSGRRLGWVAARLLSETQPKPPEQRQPGDSPTSVPEVRPPTPSAPSQAAVIARIIAQSRASYGGSCGCPDDRDAAGRRCGGRSAYSRAGGASVVCYPGDVTAAMIQQFQASR